MKNCFSLCPILLVLLISVSIVNATCKSIKQNDPRAPSGVYTITSCETGRFMKVYCEMGLNGGGYTFLSSRYLHLLSNSEIQKMITDRTSLLMRVKSCDSSCTQPYIILKQLTKYWKIPLKIALNDYSSFTRPKNLDFLQPPYQYFGFLPKSIAQNSSVQGVWANGKDYPIKNCNGNSDNYFALFPNHEEKEPTDYLFNKDFEWLEKIFGAAKVNPSRRLMPDEYFYFTEANFGSSCGGFTQTDARHDVRVRSSSAPSISAISVGFR